MGGIAFALFYSGLAIPIAWLADRKSRVNIIAVSVALWSLFTAACGLAQNFWHLFLARMGVGIGEAGGVAPSYALISDFYPEGEAGAGARLLLARHSDRLGARRLLRRLDRQPSRLALGLPHRRPRRPAGRPAGQARHHGAGARRLRQRRRQRQRAGAALRRPWPRRWRASPSFWLLSFGAASGSILGYGLIFWLPSFFSRSFDLELAEVGWFYGSIVLVGGIAGTWLGGWLGDRDRARATRPPMP